MREHLGLNEPLHVQYGLFLSAPAQGGSGGNHLDPPEGLDRDQTPLPGHDRTVAGGALHQLFCRHASGIISATKQYSIFDYFSMIGALAGVSMPIFWLGLVFMLIFSLNLGWLPLSGRLSIGIDLDVITNFYILDAVITRNWPAFKDAVWHIIMPAVTLSTIPTAIVARMTRSAMLDVLRQDYIKTAKAKGLSQFQVIFKHALRNAMIPVVTTIGLQFGVLLGGAILTETIFAWPGVGKWMYDAVMQRDYMVIQGGTLFIASLFVVINLCVDVLYAVINPRISIQ
jgi:peptide/nickel transport system permease protein